MEQVPSAAFDRVAGAFDSRNMPYYEACWNAVLPYLPDLAGRWVLDAGCKTGIITERIADDVGNWGQVVGLDVSVKMLEHARKRLADRRNINLVQAPLFEVPGRDRSFDAVLSFHMLRHFDDLSPLLREWRRILKPDGDVIVVDWDASAFSIRVVHHLFRFVDETYKKARTVGEVSQALENHGFSIVSATPLPVSVVWPVWMVRAKKK